MWIHYELLTCDYRGIYPCPATYLQVYSKQMFIQWTDYSVHISSYNHACILRVDPHEGILQCPYYNMRNTCWNIYDIMNWDKR